MTIANYKVSINSSQRLFIAGLLSEEIKNYIQNYISLIKPYFAGVKWEPKEKFHITLKFLGKVERERYLAVSKSLDELLVDIKPIKTEIKDFRAFPNFKKPKVLVVTFKENKKLNKMYDMVNSVCEKNGFPAEKRKFIPHVTIGRVKKDFRILKQAIMPENKKFNLSKISIVKSELTRASSFYSDMREWKFNSN